MQNENQAQDRQGPLKRLLNGYIWQANDRKADVAEKLGVSVGTYRRWERDPDTMPLGKLLELGRKYKIPLGELQNAIRYK